MRDVGEQLADECSKLFFGLGREVGHAADAAVHVCTAQLFLRNVLARDGLHYLRTRQEHIRNTLQHDDEVRQRRAIDRPACTRAANAANLRNNAAGLNVALENLAEARQGVNALLNARTARVVKAYAGCAHLHRKVHHLAYLLGHRQRERTAVDGEVLRKDIDQAPANRAATAHHAVAQELLALHAKVVAAMLLKHIHFFKRALVKQERNALARSGFALCVLLFDGRFAAAQSSLLSQFDEALNTSVLFSHIVWYKYICTLFACKGSVKVAKRA